MFALPIASANAEEYIEPPNSDYTGWVVQNDEHYWFDSGSMARSKEIYDPSVMPGTGSTQTEQWHATKMFISVPMVVNGFAMTK